MKLVAPYELFPLILNIVTKGRWSGTAIFPERELGLGYFLRNLSWKTSLYPDVVNIRLDQVENEAMQYLDALNSLSYVRDS